MRTCYKCGAEVADNAKFCRSCGTKLMDPEDVTVILDGEPDGPEIPRSAEVNGFSGADGYPGGDADGYHGSAGGYPGGAGGYPGEGGYPGGGSAYPGGNGGYPGGSNGGYPGGTGGYPGSSTGSRRPAAPVRDWDHTNEFDPKDVSENKAVAMLVYLLGFVGIIIALLAGTTSPYASFHVRQGLKFVVLDTLIGIVAAIFFLIMIPFSAGSVLGGYGGGYYDSTSMLGGLAALGGFAAIVYILLGVFMLILGIVKIICFFSICKGEAKEPPIVRAFGFMR